MYELIILAQLMGHPAHGYLIAKIINDIIGPYARISNGRLYPLLSKLEQSGFIAVHTEATPGPHGDRQLRTYQITEAGKKRFHDLMMDTTTNPGEYQKLFSRKASYFDFLKPAERLRLIDHYMNYCQAHILHLTSEADDFARNAPSWGHQWTASYIEDVLGFMQHSIDQWQLELDWAKSLREKEIARTQAVTSDDVKQRAQQL